MAIPATEPATEDVTEQGPGLLALVKPGPGLYILREHHMDLARLLSWGFSPGEIATDLGLSVELVKRLCRAPAVKLALQELGPEIQETVRAQLLRVKALLPDCVDTVQDLMRTGDDKVRLRAGLALLDRGGMPAVKRSEEVRLGVTLTGAEIDELNQRAVAAQQEGRVVDVVAEELADVEISSGGPAAGESDA